MEAKKYLTPKEVSEKLSVSKSWVYNHIKAGHIPSIMLPGDVIRIDWEEFERQLTEPKKLSSLKSEKERRCLVSNDDTEIEWLD